jgi:multimeric flavodoxin WrbA
MKVLAIHSSPRPSEQSKTLSLLKALTDGMKDAKANVEMIELRKKRIQFCTGCYTCWTKTPGQCVLDDDMTRELYPKWLACDIAVYGTPLYNDGISAAMKAFIERTLPSYEPFLSRRKGRSYHPLRGKHPAIVILSVAGMVEEANFDLLSAHVNYLFRKSGKRLMGEIYRPGSEFLSLPRFGDVKGRILEATREAGRELIDDGEIKQETRARIMEPFGDPDELNEMGNQFWQLCLNEGVTPREFTKKRKRTHTRRSEEISQV